MYRGYIARCVLVRERETYVDSDVDGDKQHEMEGYVDVNKQSEVRVKW